MRLTHTPIQKDGFCSAFLQETKRVDHATPEIGKSNHDTETLIVSFSKNTQSNAISKENHGKCLLETYSVTSIGFP
jgi:hypothetical protein